MPYTIETSRLIMAPFTDGDMHRRVHLANNINVARMVSHMPHPYTRKDAIEWVASHDAGRTAGTDFPFALTLKGDGLVGAIGLHKKDSDDLELGYWIGEPYWGRGIASEAAQAILHWAHKHLRVTQVTACYFADNPASGRVLEKAGFSPTGTTDMCQSKARDKETRAINMIWLADQQKTR